MKKQVDISHYEFGKYITKDRFMSFYYQLKLINELSPVSLLEIGPGTGFMENNIPANTEYYSADISSDIKPDVICSADKLPFPDNSFDMTVAFQVLEHLPFELFEPAVKEMHRVAGKYTIISLPYANHHISFSLRLPGLGEREIRKLIPKSYKQHKFDGQHYWETGKKGYPVSRIKGILSRYFDFREIFVPKENSYHIFFVMDKKQDG